MKKFDIITIFPNIFSSYLEESLLKRATEKNIISVNFHDLRKWAKDKHSTVDDKPFGGGLGMVMKPQPIKDAVFDLKKESKKEKTRVILFSPRGKKFNQKKASDLAKYDRIIMICGRYEGVDERVAKYIADEEISVGSYVLMGGELPAMIVMETVSRLIPGVVGKENFLKERRKDDGFLEYPQYTRPEEVDIDRKKRGVPKVLLSGNHKEVKEWREKKGKKIK